jgi:hypothetical protein
VFNQITDPNQPGFVVQQPEPQPNQTIAGLLKQKQDELADVLAKLSVNKDPMQKIQNENQANHLRRIIANVLSGGNNIEPAENGTYYIPRTFAGNEPGRYLPADPERGFSEFKAKTEFGTTSAAEQNKLVDFAVLLDAADQKSAGFVSDRLKPGGAFNTTQSSRPIDRMPVRAAEPAQNTGIKTIDDWLNTQAQPLPVQPAQQQVAQVIAPATAPTQQQLASPSVQSPLQAQPQQVATEPAGVSLQSLAQEAQAGLTETYETNRFRTLLENPGFQNALAQAGMALTARDKNSFGFVAGQFAADNARNESAKLYADKVSGRDDKNYINDKLTYSPLDANTKLAIDNNEFDKAYKNQLLDLQKQMKDIQMTKANADYAEALKKALPDIKPADFDNLADTVSTGFFQSVKSTLTQAQQALLDVALSTNDPASRKSQLDGLLLSMPDNQRQELAKRFNSIANIAKESGYDAALTTAISLPGFKAGQSTQTPTGGGTQVAGDAGQLAARTPGDVRTAINKNSQNVKLVNSVTINGVTYSAGNYKTVDGKLVKI